MSWQYFKHALSKTEISLYQNEPYMKPVVTFIFILVLSCCFAQNRFSNDAVLRKIYGFEYDRKGDSLVPFLKSDNRTYRYVAIQSFASVQDTNYTTALVHMLALEKVDSVKLALIYSISQMDCSTAFKGLFSYYEACNQQELKWACMEALGKISQYSISDLFASAYSSQPKPNASFAAHWLKGMYLAKRRKHIDLHQHNEQLLHQLDALLELNYLPADVVSYYYSKINNQPGVAAPEPVKIPVESLDVIDAQLMNLKTPYLQVEALSKFELSAAACREILASGYHSLVKYQALDSYLTKHTWNNKIDRVFIESVFDQMDVALISRMCEYIIEQNNNKKPVDITVDVLQNLQRQLFLPRDFEATVDLEKAILSFEGKTYTYKSSFESGYQNPIDWNYIVKIKQNQRVKITTGKGVMELVLKVNEAPASVANFLKLVDSGYYNGKYFHRVVPNFVVQGGCPRGDGLGSLDWTQRSELSGVLRYKKGSVGLASAGKDSEGVQFFISHNLAPHLDGRYTIFAEVVKGLPVIDNLVIGDEMIRIERID